MLLIDDTETGKTQILEVLTVIPSTKTSHQIQEKLEKTAIYSVTRVVREGGFEPPKAYAIGS